MDCASFWQRLGAGVVDSLVLFPLAFVFFAYWLPAPLGLVPLVLGCAASPAYSIYGHGRFGQTIGKWLFGIRVHMVDGARVTWRAAWIRHAPDVLIAAVSAVGVVYTHTQLTPGTVSRLGVMEAMQSISSKTPAFVTMFGRLEEIWLWSEIVVMLLNKKRQSLHDLLAGTVVIRVEDSAQARYALR